MIVEDLKNPEAATRFIDRLSANLDVSQWPKISMLEVNDVTLKLQIKIGHELKWFEGHFPENPVLPGVVQVHWAVSLAQQFMLEKKQFRQVENLKFKSVVLPGMELILQFSGLVADEKIRFSFLSSETEEVHSEGRLLFS